MLSEKSLDSLYSRVVKTLRTAEFQPPYENESEPKFVARIVVPAIAKLVAPIRLLRVEGEGLKRPRASRMFGCSFYPDLSLMLHDERLIAIEAKYVQSEALSAQGGIASAIGQAKIYSSNGYRRSGIILFSRRLIARDEIIQSLNLCRSSGIEVIYRKIGNRELVIDPTVA